MWQPFNGVFVEPGKHGSWYNLGMSPWMPQNYFAMNWGYELLPYNASFGDHPFEGESVRTLSSFIGVGPVGTEMLRWSR